MQMLHIAGNVGKDATLKSLQNGDKVLSFSVACDNGKDKDATWYDCSVWGKRAESLERYILKGTKLALCGRPSVRVHEGKAYLGLSVSELTFQGGNQSRDEGGRQSSNSSAKPAQSAGYRDDDPDSIPF